MINDNNENINEPIHPDTVLLGLILVNFLPHTNLPMKKTPVSDNIQIDMKKTKYIGDNLYKS